jgi:pyruvate dehydrogenase E2 component (dihydrolipoamide acetyltransferase)
MTEIVMPQLSDSMESGLVLQWLIEDGQEVAVGDELLEIETDKATMAYQAEVAGVLEIVVAAGTTVPVGEVIARAGAGVPAVKPAKASAAAPEAIAAEEVEASARVEELVAIGATPLARRLASAHGVQLDSLSGSGPRGRITKQDVLSAAGIAPAAVPSPKPEPPATNGRAKTVASSGRVEQMSRLQQVIARRMAEAKATVPHFQVQTEVVMDAALGWRAELKRTLAEPPSINDLIIKVSAVALTRHPHANGSYRDGGFELHEQVNVGVAVAAEGALVVPTVFDADKASLSKIAAETRRLAQRVRSGEVTPPELSGATFTVSNLGMYGMTAITPVINPPQAAILGVGAVRNVLSREDGEIVDRSLLTLTLSCDHRILYGAEASEFLAEIRDLLANPLRLLL